jgi:hypothetical protein
MYGEIGCLSVPSVETLGLPMEDGSMMLHSRLLVTRLPTSVSIYRSQNMYTVLMNRSRLCYQCRIPRWPWRASCSPYLGPMPIASIPRLDFRIRVYDCCRGSRLSTCNLYWIIIRLVLLSLSRRPFQRSLQGSHPYRYGQSSSFRRTRSTQQ